MMPHAGRQNLQALGEKVLDLLFPARCVNCKQPNNALCPTCLATVQPITLPTCVRCGHPLQKDGAPCPECRKHPFVITRIQAAAWHDGAVREAIHALKYNRRRDVSKPLGEILAQQISKSNLRCDFVTAVPLHPTREQTRGYNQAELLAKHAAALSGMRYESVVRRTRATADQVGLDGRARRENVANAFRADAHFVAGKTILLIDDVATTGATLDACAAALVASGARAVYGLTVARPRPFR